MDEIETRNWRDHHWRVEFILNRLDNVARWVVEWMPPEDNEKHHNAVEHLRRIREEVLNLSAELDRRGGDDR